MISKEILTVREMANPENVTSKEIQLPRKCDFPGNVTDLPREDGLLLVCLEQVPGVLLLGPHHDGLDLGDLLQPQPLQLLHQLPRLLLQRLPGEPPASAGARPHGAAVSATAFAVRRFSILVNLQSKCKYYYLYFLLILCTILQPQDDATITGWNICSDPPSMV